MSADTPRTCRHCQHWHAPLKAKDIGIGECRAGPPVSSFSWPRTREDQGCHEFKQSDAGAAAPSPLAGATAGDHDTGNSPAGKAEVLSHTGPDFARGKGGARPRR